MRRRIRKFYKNPGYFFRDYLLNKYPISRNEMKLPEQREKDLINNLSFIEGVLECNLPIDVVITWVDFHDCVWQEKLKHYKNINQSELHALYASDDARYMSHDELKFSIKSIEKYIPWVNNIYIVTDAQQPAWLKTSDRIHIIDHKDIISSEYLPTFNSHVIEAFLHRIPNLTEHFIYFNDDVFVARPLEATHFFKANGIGSLFLANKKSLRAMAKKGTNTATLLASNRGRELLHNYAKTDTKLDLSSLDKALDIPLTHTYIPLQKKHFELAFKLFEPQIKTFLVNRFRSTNDLNLATYLVPWLAYIQGDAIAHSDVCYYFNIRSANARSIYTELLVKKGTDSAPHSICANDFHSQTHIPNYQVHLMNALEHYFS